MTLEELRKLKPQIQEVARRRKVDPDSIRVFGSVARGDAGKKSDVDLLVRTLPGCSLFDLGGLYNDMRDVIGCKVDVVPDNSVSKYIKERVFQEAVFL